MKYLLSIFIIFFTSCSINSYEYTKTKIIIIKSPKIKFADIGYIRNSGNSIELELFVAGNAIEKITINHLICTNDGCMSRSGFNKEYLNSNYPDNILQNIILGTAIYDSKNLFKTEDGFEQRINSKDVKIVYKVDTNKIFFKDIKNKIIFKIKDIK
jgi:hypothetical protein